jgi:hypothetical protein
MRRGKAQTVYAADGFYRMAANSPTRPTIIGAPRYDTSGMNCAVGPVRSVCSKVDRAGRRRLRRVMPPLRKVASTAKKAAALAAKVATSTDDTCNSGNINEVLAMSPDRILFRHEGLDPRL